METMLRKTFGFSVKRAPTDGSGRGSALVSTFGGEPDTQGDVVLPGAFSKTIQDWKRRGRRPALYWLHNYADPQAAIGLIDEMRETSEGLEIDFALDLDNSIAVKVYEGLLASTLGEFSIGYAVRPDDEEIVGGVRYLKQVEILEVSVVSMGANRNTRLLNIKSAESRRGTRPPPTAPAEHRDEFMRRVAAKHGVEAELFAAERRAAKAIEAAAARVTARADLERLCLALSMSRSPRVIVDEKMRPYIPDEVERERERRERECVALESEPRLEQAAFSTVERW